VIELVFCNEIGDVQVGEGKEVNGEPGNLGSHGDGVVGVLVMTKFFGCLLFIIVKQDVALTGRNTTGPPCSVAVEL